MGVVSTAGTPAQGFGKQRPACHEIGQYLARSFGSRNVVIDIDMRAGQKFPRALEERFSTAR